MNQDSATGSSDTPKQSTPKDTINQPNKYNYPCTKCGLCCQNHNPTDALAAIREMKEGGRPIDEEIFNFWPKIINGKCENLQPDNRCGIYETRPLLCRLEGTTKALNIPVELLLWHNAKACNHYMTDAGIPKDAQIDMKKWHAELTTNATEEIKRQIGDYKDEG